MKTKRLIIAILFLPFLMNCSLESNTKGDIALVEKYIQAVESLDYPTMESLLDENYMGFGPSYKDSINKVQALENWKYNVENIYERIEYKRMQNAPVKINTGPNKGDWVSSWAELSISYKSKETLIIWANTVYKVENNKIVKSLTFYNEADAYQQLGYVFIRQNDL